MKISNPYSEVQVKKHFTPEEHAMRRAEMARRRKNLSEKRNEEEKVYVFHPNPEAPTNTPDRWKPSTSS
jgi:hypothetical protein